MRGLRDRHAGLLRRQVLAHGRSRDVQRRELREQPLHARRIGRLVDAVERRQLARRQQLRDRFVGRDHQVFDQPVRLRLLGWQQRLDVTLAREAELGLARLHGQRAARLARVRERPRHLARRGQRRRPRVERALGTGEDPVHTRVVEPLVGADDRAVEGRAAHVGAVELELDGHGQPVLARHQRAGAVRERLGQHRLDQGGHVDRVRAPERLAVERGAGPHEGADVGDVDPHPHGAVLQFLGRDRVVEVLRRRRVDRERGELAEVLAARAVR